MSSPFDPFGASRVTYDAWRLWSDAAQVIWLRSLRLAEGGARGASEARRMVDEKTAANLMFWPAMIAAGPPSSPEAGARRAIGHYARPVRANRRRLSRRK